MRLKKQAQCISNEVNDSSLYWLAFHYAKVQHNVLSINGVEIQKPEGRRVSKYASYQSQNSIFALEVDGDIWFDKVAGQHGDPNTEVGWSTRLKMVTKLKWQPRCCNGNYTAIINIRLINWGDGNCRWSVEKKAKNKKQGWVQNNRCACNMLMWNAEEIKDFHNLSPKSSYPNAIIHVEMRTRQCTSLLFVLTCFGNQGKKRLHRCDLVLVFL